MEVVLVFTSDQSLYDHVPHPCLFIYFTYVLAWITKINKQNQKGTWNRCKCVQHFL